MLSQNDLFLVHLAYAVYIGISVALTVWVARTLSRTGQVFLQRCFGQDEVLAESTNRLLVIGFYLINLGFISYRLGNWTPAGEILVGSLGMRIGVTLLVLGAMHFVNMIMIARLGNMIAFWMNRQSEQKSSSAT